LDPPFLGKRGEADSFLPASFVRNVCQLTMGLKKKQTHDSKHRIYHTNVNKV